MIRRYLLLPALAVASVSSWGAPLDNLSAADVNGPAAVAPLEHPQPPARPCPASSTDLPAATTATAVFDSGALPWLH